MRARVSTAIAAGSALAFAGLGFTAVYREGFETVLFYQALAIFAQGCWSLGRRSASPRRRSPSRPWARRSSSSASGCR